MSSTLSTPAADASVREQALDVSKSFLVQAPAGSGKTELLMQRYLKLLAEGGVDEPESVLAITFTRKAASEMRVRILRALEEAAARGMEPNLPDHKKVTRELALKVLERDRVRSWQLLPSPTRLRISTIDSLGFELAQANPLIAGAATGEVTEKPAPLYREAARRAVRDLADDRTGEAVAQVLRRMDNNVPRVEALICTMLARRDHWLRVLGRTDAYSREELKHVRTELEAGLAAVVEQEIERLKESCRRAVPEAEWKSLFAFMRHCGDVADESAPLLWLLRDLQSFPGANADGIEKWKAIHFFLFTPSAGTLRRQYRTDGFPGFVRPHSSQCVELLKGIADSALAEELCAAFKRFASLPPLRYTEDEWQCIEALFKVLPRAVAHLKVVFAEENAVDFVEVAQAARDALGTREHPSDLALALGYKVQHLLIDEFQDTSKTQMDLFSRLTASWDEFNTVFAVGDPKQSIYRFREAEVKLFTGAVKNEEVAGCAAELAELSANFRSQERLVKWYNAVFPEILTGAVRYSGPVTATKPAIAGAAVTVRGQVGKNHAAEAEAVVAAVREALTETDGEICILVRARTHAPAIVAALHEARIRFRGVDLEELRERPAVSDLHALMSALLHEGDRLTWLAVLRAPWCGLELADLWELCRGDRFSTIPELLRARAAELSPRGQERLARVHPVLERALERRERIGVRALVEGTWIALGGPSAVRQGNQGQQDLRDAAAYLQLLGKCERGGTLDRVAFEDRLRELYSPPDNGDGIRVQFMTIHGAKGLEFDTVIVPGLGRKTRGPDTRLLYWREHPLTEQDIRLLIAPVAATVASEGEGAIASYIRLADEEAEREEAKRLLYVAATRAKRRLHLFGHLETTRDGDAKPAKGTLLELLMESPTFRAEFERSLPDEDPDTGEGDETPEQPSRTPMTLRRLAPEWQIGMPPAALPWFPKRAAKGAAAAQTDENQTNRITGTVAHAFFEQIAREGLERWDGDEIARRMPAVRAQLKALGLPPTEVEREAERVAAALRSTLSDPAGRWVLAPHEDARCEWELCVAGDAGVRRVKIDRSFVEDGVRWIIDYKLTHDSDLDAQAAHYREAILGYRDVLALADKRPIRAALYFPLQRRLVEIPLEGSSNQARIVEK